MLYSKQLVPAREEDYSGPTHDWIAKPWRQASPQSQSSVPQAAEVLEYADMQQDTDQQEVKQSGTSSATPAATQAPATLGSDQESDSGSEVGQPPGDWVGARPPALDVPEQECHKKNEDAGAHAAEAGRAGPQETSTPLPAGMRRRWDRIVTKALAKQESEVDFEERLRERSASTQTKEEVNPSVFEEADNEFKIQRELESSDFELKEALPTADPNTRARPRLPRAPSASKAQQENQKVNLSVLERADKELKNKKFEVQQRAMKRSRSASIQRDVGRMDFEEKEAPPTAGPMAEARPRFPRAPWASTKLQENQKLRLTGRAVSPSVSIQRDRKGQDAEGRKKCHGRRP